jgi:hypothetical protein
MSIVLNYRCEDGDRKSASFGQEVQTIRLAGIGITNVDLTPLSSCTNLTRLELQENKLGNLDLTPLSSCTNLEVLYMWGNPLEHIDLTPLGTCPNLQQSGI